jgi:hypothetical protein
MNASGCQRCIKGDDMALTVVAPKSCAVEGASNQPNMAGLTPIDQHVVQQFILCVAPHHLSPQNKRQRRYVGKQELLLGQNDEKLSINKVYLLDRAAHAFCFLTTFWPCHETL